MVRPRTAVVPPATTISWKPSAIQTISDMRSCGNGWATILIRRPFRSMTSTADSHPCSAAGPRIRTREPCSSSGRLGYAGLPKAHDSPSVRELQRKSILSRVKHFDVYRKGKKVGYYTVEDAVVLGPFGQVVGIGTATGFTPG